MSKKFPLSKSFNDRRQIIITGVFLVLLLSGISSYRQFGVPWDETTERQRGLVAWDYITGKNRQFLSLPDRYYGTWYELFLITTEKITRPPSADAILHQRHLLIFLTSWLGSISLFFLTRELLGSWKAGLAAVLLIALHPRIAADAFYNSKDLVFSAMCVFTVLFQTRFLKSSTIKKLIALAIFSGLCASARLIGLIFPVITMVLYLRPEKSRIINSLIYIVIFTATLYFTWPAIWTDPIGNFKAAFIQMSDFTRFTDAVYYLGRLISPTHLPWHYLPVWIIISTPILFLVLFLTGIIHPANLKNQQIWSIYLWLLIPLIYTIFWRPVMYDGWRHYYFLAPALAIFAASGLKNCYNRFNHSVVIGLFALGLLFPGLFIIRHFPYFNVYFNPVAQKVLNSYSTFDLDFWGLSFRSGLEYIAGIDSGSPIQVYFAYGSSSQIDILAPADAARIVAVKDPKSALYVLTNFRWQNPGNFSNLNPDFSQTVNGRPIMSVYSRSVLTRTD